MHSHAKLVETLKVLSCSACVYCAAQCMSQAAVVRVAKLLTAAGQVQHQSQQQPVLLLMHASYTIMLLLLLLLLQVTWCVSLARSSQAAWCRPLGPA
jgi:hypothetical protein